MYETYPYYTKEGVNKGKDYKCKPNEVGILDYDNKKFIITKIKPLDDKKVKKTIITLKGNLKGAKSIKDVSTSMYFVDSYNVDSLLFIGTDKQLSVYADRLLEEGYNIKDFYDYE